MIRASCPRRRRRASKRCYAASSVLAGLVEDPLDRPRIVQILVEIVEKLLGFLEPCRRQSLDVAQHPVDRILLRLEEPDFLGEAGGVVAGPAIDTGGGALDAERVVPLS